MLTILSNWSKGISFCVRLYNFYLLQEMKREINRRLNRVPEIKFEPKLLNPTMEAMAKSGKMCHQGIAAQGISKFSRSILSLFREFNKYNNTGARMLDSIYHMALTLLCNRIFGVQKSIFCHIYAALLWASFHNVTKICKHWWFTDFITWGYITPRCDVI